MSQLDDDYDDHPVGYYSAHPAHIQIGLAIGEITRILTLSCDNNIYTKHATKLFHNLLNRGYPKRKLKYLFSKYPYSRRQSLLHTKKNLKKETTDTVRLICEFHPAYPTRTLKQALQGPSDWPGHHTITHCRTILLPTVERN